MKFFKNHLYETVLALVILIFGSSIAAFYKSVLASLASYPLEIAILCAFALFVGLFVSSLLDRRSAMLRRIEEDGRSERAKIEAAKDEAIRREDREFAERERERTRAEQIKAAEKERSDKILQFSEVQLTYMLHCLCEEKTNRGIGIRTHAFDPVAESLEDLNVFTSGRIDDDEMCFYSLTPEWRRFVIDMEHEIREYLGA